MTSEKRTQFGARRFFTAYVINFGGTGTTACLRPVSPLSLFSYSLVKLPLKRKMPSKNRAF